MLVVSLRQSFGQCAPRRQPKDQQIEGQFRENRWNHPINSNCVFAKSSNVPSYLSVFRQGVTLVHWKLQIQPNTITCHFVQHYNNLEAQHGGRAVEWHCYGSCPMHNFWNDYISGQMLKEKPLQGVSSFPISSMSEDLEIMSDLCISNLGFPSALYACKLAASWSSSAESQMAKWVKQKNSHPVNDRAIRSSSGRSFSGLKCGTCWCQQWGAWSGAWFPSWARLLLVCWRNLQSIDCSVAVTMIQNSCQDRVQGPTMRQTNNDTSSWLQSLPYSEACCNLQQLRRYQNHFRDSPTVKIIKSWSANNDSKLDMHPILTFIEGMAFFSRKDFTCLDRNGAYCFQMFCADCLDVHWIMRMLRGKLGDGVTIPHYHFLHSIVHHHHISLLSLPNLHIKNDTLCQFFHCLSSASHLLRPWHSPLPQDLAVAVELQQAAPVLHRFAFPKCEGTWIRKVVVVDINGKFQWLYKYKL